LLKRFFVKKKIAGEGFEPPLELHKSFYLLVKNLGVMGPASTPGCSIPLSGETQGSPPAMIIIDIICF